MEFPELGKHCTFDSCHQLDFLPYTCYRCKKIFCQDHFKLDDHHCPSLQDGQYDARVPTCPICEQPVPGPRGQDPNISVNRHIQNNCNDKRQTASNICHQRACNAKLLVPMNCSDCGYSFCVKHRLPVDHTCRPTQKGASQKRPAASSSSKRNSKQDQELARLTEKANANRLTEAEQARLAALRRKQKKPNCIIS
ncbi:CRE-AIP-1 protein [Lichtheimia hyalospora FSU 10163]|nr:CRE-AIP-1 protein [Lichtheimia hyalospora FSU 10163]